MKIVEIIFAHPKWFTIYANDAVASFSYPYPSNLLDYWQWSFTFINRVGKTVKTKHKTFCGSFFSFVVFLSVTVFIFVFFVFPLFCLLVSMMFTYLAPCAQKYNIMTTDVFHRHKNHSPNIDLSLVCPKLCFEFFSSASFLSFILVLQTVASYTYRQCIQFVWRKIFEPSGFRKCLE